MSTSYTDQDWYKNTIPQLKRHEGFRSSAYTDHKGNKTIGYGFNIDPVKAKEMAKYFGKYGISDTTTKAQADKALHGVIKDLYMPSIYKSVPNFDELSDNAKGVVLNMMYNLGQNKFNEFEKMRGALAKKDYRTARAEMLDSKWARDAKVRNRVNELAEQMYYTGKNLPGVTETPYNPYHNRNGSAVSNAKSVQQPIETTKNVNQNPEHKYHTVEQGDTLSGISKKYNVPLNKLYRLNKINPKIKNPIIRTDQQIRVSQNQPEMMHMDPSIANQPMTVTASTKVNWSKIANDINNKLAMMKKEIPVNTMTDLEVKPMAVRKDKVPINVKRLLGRIVKENNKTVEKTAETKIHNIEDLFEAIYNEDKKYWPHGLNLSLYNGENDAIKLIKDKDNNLAGFTAVQVRDNLKDKPTAFYSVGILPEYRGKGLASIFLRKLIEENKGKDYKHTYTVHKDNKPSLSLYNNLVSD